MPQFMSKVQAFHTPKNSPQPSWKRFLSQHLSQQLARFFVLHVLSILGSCATDGKTFKSSLKTGGFNISVGLRSRTNSPTLKSKFTAVHEEFPWVRKWWGWKWGKRWCSKMVFFFSKAGVKVAQIDIYLIHCNCQTIYIYVLSSRCIVLIINDSYECLCKCVQVVFETINHLDPLFLRLSDCHPLGHLACSQWANLNTLSLYALPMPRNCFLLPASSPM